MNNIIEYYIIGCCFLVWIGGSIWAIKYTRSQWPILFFIPTEAIITHLQVRKVPTVPSNEFDSGGDSSELFLSYKFTVDDKNYKGTDEGGHYEYEYPDGSARGKKRKNPLYDGKKKEGDAVTVYYNPKNPRENSHQRYTFSAACLLSPLPSFFLFWQLI